MKPGFLNKNYQEFVYWLKEEKEPELIPIPEITTDPHQIDFTQKWVEVILSSLHNNKGLIKIEPKSQTNATQLDPIKIISIPKKNSVTNIGNLVCTKSYTPQKIENLNVRYINFYSHDKIEIENCWIDTLKLSRSTNCNIILKNTWIGKIIFEFKCLHDLEWEGGGLLSISCPTPDQDNPFTGHIHIGKKVYLPSCDGEYIDKKYGSGEKTGPQNWTNIRAHLMKLDNIEAAGRFHSVEQKIERPLLSIAPRICSWIYDLCSDYGNSISRPIFIILWWGWISFCLFAKPGALHPSPESHFPHVGRKLQALWLSVESVLNPLEILNDKEYFEPTRFYLVVAHSLHRLFVILMMFFLFLALRRKFRISAG